MYLTLVSCPKKKPPKPKPMLKIVVEKKKLKTEIN